MKVGDLVRCTSLGTLALVLQSDYADGADEHYQFPEVMWLDTGEIDYRRCDYLEVVNENR